MRQRRHIIVARCAIASVCVLFVAPVLYMVSIAFRYQAVAISIDRGPSPLASGWTLQNFVEAVNRGCSSERVLTSCFIMVSVVSCCAVLGLPAAYAISRLPGSTRQRLSVSFFSVRLLPGIAVCLPIFWMLHHQGVAPPWLSYGLLQVGLNLPVLVWLSVPVFSSISPSLIELALIQGLPRWAILPLLVIPIAGMRITGVLLAVALLVWNETFFASLFGVATVTENVPSLIAHRGIQWGPIMAIGTLITIPAFIVFAGLLWLTYRRQLLSDLT